MSENDGREEEPGWKEEAVRAAFRALRSPKVKRVITNEKVQRAVVGAFKAGVNIKHELEVRSEKVARQFNLATRDDLKTMKRELDRLQRQVAKLKKDAAEREPTDEDS